MFYDFIPNTLISFVEKMREAFAVQKHLKCNSVSIFFSKKIFGVFEILKFEILTKH